MSHLKKALEKAKAERKIALGKLSDIGPGGDGSEKADDVFSYLHRRIDATFDLRNSRLNGPPGGECGAPSPAAIPSQEPLDAKAGAPPAAGARTLAANAGEIADLGPELKDALSDVARDLDQDLRDISLEDGFDLQRELESALNDVAPDAGASLPAVGGKDALSPGEGMGNSALDALRNAREASMRVRAEEHVRKTGTDAGGSVVEDFPAREPRDIKSVPDAEDILATAAAVKPESLPGMLEGATRPDAAGRAEGEGGAQTPVVSIPEEVFVKNRLVAALDGNPSNEHFKLLRTQLFQYTRQRGLNAIQVSGFSQGDGASLVALNLAISIAKDARQTTVLVDFNFRKPSIARLLGLEDSPGLRSHFLDGVPLEQIFISPGIRKLTVLPAGGTIANPTELLGSPKVENLVRELKTRYRDRYVIFDTPGIGECPDPLVISEYVDGLVLIARARRTPQAGIKAAMNLLPKEKIFGIVLNDVLPEECDL